MQNEMSVTSKIASLLSPPWGSWKGLFLMMREEKLFSGIYIAGTAMALAFTMVMAVVYYIKLAPIYPERNRTHTVYLDGIVVQAEKDGKIVGATSYHFSDKAFEEWLLPSKNYEHCALTVPSAGSVDIGNNKVETMRKGKDAYVDAIVCHTNADFFRIYSYDFVEGRPFTKQEVEAREHVCVISDDFARKYFGRGETAEGKTVVTEGGTEMRVVGVVRGASSLTPDSYIQLFRPYTIFPFYNPDSPYTGIYDIVLTVKDNRQLQALRRELEEIGARLTQAGTIKGSISREGATEKIVLSSSMQTHPMHTLRKLAGEGIFRSISKWQVGLHLSGILFVLLVVPALNLCGIVAGRMERRSAEMAVRKTFGARRSTLLWQVVGENLVLTGIGGILGLVASWLAIYAFRTQILGMFFDLTTDGAAPLVTGEMLFAPLLFLGAFAAVLVLNLLAALLPAWWSLRSPIVEAMMEKR